MAQPTIDIQEDVINNNGMTMRQEVNIKTTKPIVSLIESHWRLILDALRSMYIQCDRNGLSYQAGRIEDIADNIKNQLQISTWQQLTKSQGERH